VESALMQISDQPGFPLHFASASAV
jgi:hypothetical protein